MLISPNGQLDIAISPQQHLPSKRLPGDKGVDQNIPRDLLGAIIYASMPSVSEFPSAFPGVIWLCFLFRCHKIMTLGFHFKALGGQNTIEMHKFMTPVGREIRRQEVKR